MPNFDEMSQSTAEIKLLSVLENGRPPYWNSVSCFDFDEIVIGMSFYLPNAC